MTNNCNCNNAPNCVNCLDCNYLQFVLDDCGQEIPYCPFVNCAHEAEPFESPNVFGWYF